MLCRRCHVPKLLHDVAQNKNSSKRPTSSPISVCVCVRVCFRSHQGLLTEQTFQNCTPHGLRCFGSIYLQVQTRGNNALGYLLKLCFETSHVISVAFTQTCSNQSVIYPNFDSTDHIGCCICSFSVRSHTRIWSGRNKPADPRISRRTLRFSVCVRVFC